jgi:hypothetical protein
MNRARFVENDPPERYAYSDGVYKAVGRWVDDEGRSLKERAKKMMRDGHGHAARVNEWFVPSRLEFGPVLRIVASESDAVALTDAGFPAVSVPNGDNSETPEPIWPAGTRLIVLGDNDPSGQMWAARAAAELGAEVGTVPAGFKDAREAIEGGRVDADSWRAAQPRGLHADLSWLLTGERPEVPVPSVTKRHDGVGLFYRGKVNGVFGDPETGKSWVAMAACAEELNAGGAAWYVDIDHNGVDGIVERFIRLGVRVATLADPSRFQYLEPQDADEMRQVVEAAIAAEPGVLVLDSLGELMPLMGASSKDNDEITVALRDVATPPARAGWCVITVDHLTKSRESGTAFAIGGMAKKRAVDGSYLRVSPIGPPMRAGAIGRARLSIEKDRFGGLRAASPDGGKGGVFVLDSTGETRTRWHIESDRTAAELETQKAHDAMRLVAEFLEAQDSPVSMTAVEKGVKGLSTEAKRETTRALESAGFVVMEARGSGWAIRSVKPYPGTLDALTERWEEEAES